MVDGLEKRDGVEKRRADPAAGAGSPVWHVGVISDTHGRLDARVLEVFRGVDRIVHAGDVGDERVLQQLAPVAPVTAVNGNMDAGLAAVELPAEAVLEVGGVKLLVGHIKDHLLRRHDPAREGIAVVISGHSHRARISEDHGVLFVNPGTANRTRGFGRPATVVLLRIANGSVQARIEPL